MLLKFIKLEEDLERVREMFVAARFTGIWMSLHMAQSDDNGSLLPHLLLYSCYVDTQYIICYKLSYFMYKSSREINKKKIMA
jgi:hypothetical protein